VERGVSIYPIYLAVSTTRTTTPDPPPCRQYGPTWSDIGSEAPVGSTLRQDLRQTINVHHSACDSTQVFLSFLVKA